MSFHGLKAHLLVALNTTSCLDGPLFVQPYRGHLGGFPALAIRNKAVISIYCALPFLFCFESFSPFQDTFNLFTSYFSSGL